MPCSIARLQYPAAHRHARHVFVVSRDRGRADARRGQLHRLSARRFSRWGRAISWGIVPTQLPIVRARSWSPMRPAASIGCRPRLVRRSGSAPAGARYAGMPVARRVGAAVPAVRAGRRASRRSFTSRTSVRRNRTPAPGTSSMRLPPWFLVARRSSADAARCGERVLGLLPRCRCCGTDCTWRRCRRS